MRRILPNLICLGALLCCSCGGSVGEFFERVFVAPTDRVIRALGDRIKLDIAEDTFSKVVTFLFANVLGLPGDGATLIAAAIDFKIEGEDPAKPMVIQVKYDPANIPDGVLEQSLLLYRVSGDEFTPVPGSTVDIDTDTVTAEITEGATYAVGAPPVVKSAKG